LIFILSFSIGVFSSIKDPQFVSSILGENYVTMTEQNIAAGDPMAVYKQSQEMDMFFGITLNNLMVAFRTYVLGIFLGIGTLGSLAFNGVMVGCFQYYFIGRGFFIDSASSIWLHGTLEISSIILAGGAGLTLGRGLIFPGTYSRLQSVQISGIRSLKMMLGITPIFILAAVIESFLTRYTDTPLFVKVALILLSAVFIVGYFVIFPWLKSRSGFEVPLKELRLRPSGIEPVNFVRIKNNADILKDTFQFYARHNRVILPWIFIVSSLIAAAKVFFVGETFNLVASEWWVSLFSDMVYILDMPSPEFILINGLGTGFIFYRVMMLIDGESKNTTTSFHLKPFIQTVIISTTIYAGIYLDVLGILFVFFAWGFLVFVGFVQLKENCSLTKAFAQGWDMFGQNRTQGMSIQFVVLLLSFSFLLVVSAPLIYIHTSILRWNFVATDLWSQKTIQFVESFIKTFSFHLILPLLVASLSYVYFSQSEAMTATNLKELISKIGARDSKANRR